MASFSGETSSELRDATSDMRGSDMVGRSVGQPVTQSVGWPYGNGTGRLSELMMSAPAPRMACTSGRIGFHTLLRERKHAGNNNSNQHTWRPVEGTARALGLTARPDAQPLIACSGIPCSGTTKRLTVRMMWRTW